VYQDPAGKPARSHESAPLHQFKPRYAGRSTGSGSKLSHQVGGENGFFGGLFQGRKHGRFEVVEGFALSHSLFSRRGDFAKQKPREIPRVLEEFRRIPKNSRVFWQL
jgi:hypothetical protein